MISRMKVSLGFKVEDFCSTVERHSLIKLLIFTEYFILCIDEYFLYRDRVWILWLCL
jgi:hypothetical protein